MNMQHRLQRALSIEDLRRLSQQRLPRSVFEFIDGGAEDEITLRNNRLALERIEIAPRVLTDVSQPDLSTRLMDSALAAPIVVAPMGSCMLAWPQADIAIARAAAAHGIPYTLSTMSTTGIEHMAEAVQSELWFQLYVLRDHQANFSLVDRARAAGYTTLVVTVDLQAGGKREKDLRNGISVPLRMHWRHLWEGMTHPGWAWQMLRHGMPQFENVRGLLGDESAGLTIAARVGQNLDAAFGWDDLARLRERWSGKLVVKGVEHPMDALRLASMGVDGVWVSNHGGRQLDGAQASAKALSRLSHALKGQVPLILDSGIRRGVDILKARALGAGAVAIGRAALFGAAVAGEAGVLRALDILTDELRLAMKLAGTPRIQDVGRDLLAPDTQPHPL